jgi:hypothetical protein
VFLLCCAAHPIGTADAREWTLIDLRRFVVVLGFVPKRMALTLALSRKREREHAEPLRGQFFGVLRQSLVTGGYPPLAVASFKGQSDELTAVLSRSHIVFSLI